MFSSITSFTLFFFLPMCIAILLGILFEETLIRIEQRVFRLIKALPGIIRAALR